MAARADVADGLAGLDDVEERVSARFGRFEPRRGLSPRPAGATLHRRPERHHLDLTHAPEATTPDDSMKIVGSRWSVESPIEQRKGEVGLDQYELRSWMGRRRHVTFAMLALADLAAVRKGAVGDVDLKSLAEDLLPLTAPEVRHLLAAVIAERARHRFFEPIRTITADRVFPDGNTLMQALADSKPTSEIEARAAR